MESNTRIANILTNSEKVVIFPSNYVAHVLSLTNYPVMDTNGILSKDSLQSYFYTFLNHYQGSHTKRIIEESFELLGDLWIHLLAGIFFTVLIKMFLTKEQLAAFFSNRAGISVLMASLIGVISPLGSYVAIPLAAALLMVGTPLPVIIAFVVSTPIINPNLFLLTAGAFGYELAVLRVIAAFLLGIIAGYLTLVLIRVNFLSESNAVKEPGNNHFFDPVVKKKQPFLRTFGIEFYKMSKYISRFFFLAIVLAATIKILTPPNLMIRLFDGNNFWSVLLSTGAGLPFYVCGGAAIPVVQELADLGLSKGSVLAFFISGPVTRISNLLLVRSAFNIRIFLLYLSIGVIGAFSLGMIYNLF